MPCVRETRRDCELGGIIVEQLRNGSLLLVLPPPQEDVPVVAQVGDILLRQSKQRWFTPSAKAIFLHIIPLCQQIEQVQLSRSFP